MIGAQRHFAPTADGGGCQLSPLPSSLLLRRSPSGLAQHLLSPTAALDVNAAKVKRLYLADLQQAAADGRCGPNLYAFAVSLRSMMKGDVQNCEGMNSLIRAVTDKCRNIGLPLLSARCVLKRALGVGARGAITKWSAMLPSISVVMGKLLGGFHRGSRDQTDQSQHPLARDGHGPRVATGAVTTCCFSAAAPPPLFTPSSPVAFRNSSSIM